MSLLKCDPKGDACAVERLVVQPSRLQAGGTPAPQAEIAAAPVLSWSRRMAPGLGVALMFCFMLGWWTTKHEWYPLTCMQMFTWYNADEKGNPTSVVNYWRAYVTYEDGHTEIAKFEKMGGGVARYKLVLEAPFLPKVPQPVREKGRRECIALMTRSANWWNANAATPGKRIVRMETHHKQWDFVKERDDHGKWGKTVDKVAVDIDPVAADRLATSARASAGG
jgi:hypothetical protein